MNYCIKGKKLFRSSILYFKKDPSKSKDDCFVYYKDALLIIKDGKIEALGKYKELKEKYKINKKYINHKYKDKLIMPGFIDTHVHYAQTEIIASFGEQLLPWLKKYTFPTEMKFSDKKYAKKISKFFINELFKNGTTTAMVFATIHKQSVNAIFEEANKYKMRLIAGKVMMDKNAPKKLLDEAEQSYKDSEELIKKWHKKDRLLYAITPRFAPTSSKKQLELAGRLKRKYPSTYVQTHLSENIDEIKWVKSLFPESNSYLDVYDKYALVSKRCIFAHAIHLEEQEYKILNKKGASVSFCPTSNLFLGSGLFNIRKMKSNNIEIGLGSDVGAGTTFSILKTINEAYKVVSMEQKTKNRKALRAFEAFYQVTLGAAKSLDLHNKIGKLEKGYEADFIVLDFKVDQLQKLRIEKIEESKSSIFESLEEKLFSLMMMGDDRNILATFVNGEKVYSK